MPPPAVLIRVVPAEQAPGRPQEPIYTARDAATHAEADEAITILVPEKLKLHEALQHLFKELSRHFPDIEIAASRGSSMVRSSSGLGHHTASMVSQELRPRVHIFIELEGWLESYNQLRELKEFSRNAQAKQLVEDLQRVYKFFEVFFRSSYKVVVHPHVPNKVLATYIQHPAMWETESYNDANARHRTPDFVPSECLILISTTPAIKAEAEAQVLPEQVVVEVEDESSRLLAVRREIAFYNAAYAFVVIQALVPVESYMRDETDGGYSVRFQAALKEHYQPGKVRGDEFRSTGQTLKESNLTRFIKSTPPRAALLLVLLNPDIEAKMLQDFEYRIYLWQVRGLSRNEVAYHVAALASLIDSLARGAFAKDTYLGFIPKDTVPLVVARPSSAIPYAVGTLFDTWDKCKTFLVWRKQHRAIVDLDECDFLSKQHLREVFDRGSWRKFLSKDAWGKSKHVFGNLDDFFAARSWHQTKRIFLHIGVLYRNLLKSKNFYESLRELRNGIELYFVTQGKLPAEMVSASLIDKALERILNSVDLILAYMLDYRQKSLDVLANKENGRINTAIQRSSLNGFVTTYQEFLDDVLRVNKTKIARSLAETISFGIAAVYLEDGLKDHPVANIISLVSFMFAQITGFTRGLYIEGKLRRKYSAIFTNYAATLADMECKLIEDYKSLLNEFINKKRKFDGSEAQRVELVGLLQQIRAIKTTNNYVVIDEIYNVLLGKREIGSCLLRKEDGGSKQYRRFKHSAAILAYCQASKIDPRVHIAKLTRKILFLKHPFNGVAEGARGSAEMKFEDTDEAPTTQRDINAGVPGIEMVSPVTDLPAPPPRQRSVEGGAPAGDIELSNFIDDLPPPAGGEATTEWGSMVEELGLFGDATPVHQPLPTRPHLPHQAHAVTALQPAATEEELDLPKGYIPLQTLTAAQHSAAATAEIEDASPPMRRRGSSTTSEWSCPSKPIRFTRLNRVPEYTA